MSASRSDIVTPGTKPAFTLSFAQSINDVGREVWNRLDVGDQPFVSFDFLEALEQTGTVGEATGWIPQHAVLRASATNEVVAAMPAYLKLHSWGEFVFDWAWADAYRRYGLDYYPKLLCAIPFTPVTGNRILIARDVVERASSPVVDLLGDTHQAAPTAHGERAAGLRRSMLSSLAAAVQELDVSSFHLLFPRDDEREAMAASNYLMRKDCQFHWHNRDYEQFADYLATFASAKRKKVKRERRRMEEEGISFEWLTGDTLDEATWDTVYRFYASTFHKRGHHPYFPPGLFPVLGERMGESLLVCLARQGDRPVACAVFFRDNETLYGRYWGCEEEFHSLHFETCYYQGIEFCIREGLKHFEPGTQGEHKLSRGFEPTATWSGHVIGEPAFARAIEQYVGEERNSVDAYMDSANRHLPFKRGDNETPTGDPRVTE